MKRFFSTLRQWLIWHILLKRRNKVTPILKKPDTRLTQVAEQVDFMKTTKRQRLAWIRQMSVALYTQKFGHRLGIAAPQVGIPYRIIIVMGIQMFNPEWVPVNNLTKDAFESCYSLPELDVYRVPRAKYGWAKWYDEDGKFHQKKFNDIKAIVFQHEYSHLEGKCCDDLGTLEPKPTKVDRMVETKQDTKSMAETAEYKVVEAFEIDGATQAVDTVVLLTEEKATELGAKVSKVEATA